MAAMGFQLPLPTFLKAIAIVCAIGSLSNTHFANAFVPHQKCSSNAILRLSSNSGNSNSHKPVSSLPPPSVLCVGETLWDSLPSGIYLGGAPSNVAAHLASLFHSSKHNSSLPTNNNNNPTVAIAACLGNDQLGKEAHRRLSIKGVRTDYIQFHHAWETGMATAILDENGDATYEFNTPAAWDGLQLEERLLELIQNKNADDEVQSTTTTTRVFIMGSIAGRLQNDQGATSSSTIMTIRNSAPEGTIVLDVNLRSPWYTPESVLQLAQGSKSVSSEGESPNKLALLKLNEEELSTLEEWCGLNSASSDGIENDSLTGDELKQRMEQLAIHLNTQRVCVTRGKDGAALYCKGETDDDDNNNLFYENPGIRLTTSNNDSDTVGAGDAFLAALVNSLFIQNESPERALERACALGGYVAGCRGATPEHGDAPDDLRHVFSE